MAARVSRGGAVIAGLDMRRRPSDRNQAWRRMRASAPLFTFEKRPASSRIQSILPKITHNPITKAEKAKAAPPPAPKPLSKSIIGAIRWYAAQGRRAAEIAKELGLDQPRVKAVVAAA